MSEKRALGDLIPDNQIQAEIFKLKMDHFEELFDWLSLWNLAVLGQTCKRMQHIIGYYIETNYSAIKFELRKDGILANAYSAVDQIKMDGFSTFLRKLVFRYLEHMAYVSPECKIATDTIPHMKADQFKSLTEIQLTRVTITDNGLSRIKEILGQIETVKLEFSSFEDENAEFYESFLQFCSNLKRLCIYGQSIASFVGVDNSWLQRKYPTLEHFEITRYAFNEEIIELPTFFEQNPNIKTFATNSEIFLANRNIFTKADIKLDVLCVEFKDRDYAGIFNLFRGFLNELHDRGVFKQLHVYATIYRNSTIDQKVINLLNSFNGLTKLVIEFMENGIYDLSHLIKLKQLCISDASCVTNMAVAKKLENLEFIQFTRATVDHITPFISHSPKLNTIVVFRLQGNYEHLLKIDKLNGERSKLVNARKVTIYVEEFLYLMVKWAKNQTNWSLIDIKRGASYDAPNQNFDDVNCVVTQF